MDLKNRISAFVKLGRSLSGIITGQLLTEAEASNGWFTGSEISRALEAWTNLLTLDHLTTWTAPYNLPDDPSAKNILVITAGNIPLVGFHDFLSVLISGNRFKGRLSSRDDLLLTRLAEVLILIEPGFTEYIDLKPSTAEPEAVIATGSNNSARYFQTEYGHLPHIIRKNRSSAAIVDGSETDEDLKGVASDILGYYGLGCRNVSHIFFPQGYAADRLVGPLSGHFAIDSCTLYADNLRYQRARLQMNSISFIDAGQTLLVENDSLHSPIGVVHFSYYPDTEALFGYLYNQRKEIQCITGHSESHPGLIPFGYAQKPELWDYADGVDTLEFLISC